MPNNPKMLSGGDVKPAKFDQNLGQAEYFTDFEEIEEEPYTKKAKVSFSVQVFSLRDVLIAMLYGFGVGLLVVAFWL